LTKTLAPFQTYINDYLWLSIADITVYYLDHLLIYSTNEKQEEDNVRKALQHLQQFQLYCKANQ